jgi:hypothetical protein
MFTHLWCRIVSHPLLADVPPPPQRLIDKLDPVTRTKLLMVFLGLVILALGMMVMISMGARFVRRLSKDSRQPTPIRHDAWYKRPEPDMHDQDAAP